MSVPIFRAVLIPQRWTAMGLWLTKASVVQIDSGVVVRVMMSCRAFGAIVMAVFCVLAPHHGKCRSRSSSAETGLSKMHFFVLCAVLKLQQLVSRKGGGSNPDHKVDVFTKVSIIGEV